MKQFFNQRVSGGIFRAALLMAFLAGLDGATSGATVRGDASGKAVIGAASSAGKQNIKIGSNVTKLVITGYVENLDFADANALTEIKLGREGKFSFGAAEGHIDTLKVPSSVTTLTLKRGSIGTLDLTDASQSLLTTLGSDSANLNRVVNKITVKAEQSFAQPAGYTKEFVVARASVAQQIVIDGSDIKIRQVLRKRRTAPTPAQPVTVRIPKEGGLFTEMRGPQVTLPVGTLDNIELMDGLLELIIPENTTITKSIESSNGHLKKGTQTIRQQLNFPESLQTLKIYGDITDAIECKKEFSSRDFYTLNLSKNINLISLEISGDNQIHRVYLPTSLNETFINTDVEAVEFSRQESAQRGNKSLKVGPNAFIKDLSVPNYLTTLHIESNTDRHSYIDEKHSRIQWLDLIDASDNLKIEGDFSRVDKVRITQNKKTLWVGNRIPEEKLDFSARSAPATTVSIARQQSDKVIIESDIDRLHRQNAEAERKLDAARQASILNLNSETRNAYYRLDYNGNWVRK